MPTANNTTASPNPVLCVLGCRSPGGAPYPTDNGYRSCARCAERLRGVVREIVDRYAVIALPAAALPRVGSSDRRSPGFGSRSPASDHIIALRDVRTVATEAGDPHSPLAILWAWARAVRSGRQLAEPATPPTVATEANTLLFHWDWVMREPWVDEMSWDFREVVSQLRAVTGAQKPRPIGRCPNVVTEDEQAWTCDTLLFVPPAGDTVRCRGCGREWPREEWLRLGDLITRDARQSGPKIGSDLR